MNSDLEPFSTRTTMEILEQLGMALGLASLAGINLYLTVLVTGLAIRFDWLTLADRFESLQILANPAVIGVALTLFLIEFFTDKIPWLDSLWDVIHTIVRPVGGTLLALQVLGDMPMAAEIVAALLGGGAATTTHATKTATRLMVNSSPEPFSNVAVSTGEDVAVAGGLTLLFAYPVVAFFVFLVLLLILWWLLPRMWRTISATLWLLVRKMRVPGRSNAPADELPHSLKAGQLEAVTAEAGGRKPVVRWALHCASGRCRGRMLMAPNWRGVLVCTDDSDPVLYFVRRHLSGNRAIRIAPGIKHVHWESRFLADHLFLQGAQGTHDQAVFRFPRGSGGRLEVVVDDLRTAWDLKSRKELKREQGEDSETDLPAADEPPADAADDQEPEEDEEDLSSPNPEESDTR